LKEISPPGFHDSHAFILRRKLDEIVLTPIRIAKNGVRVRLTLMSPAKQLGHVGDGWCGAPGGRWKRAAVGTMVGLTLRLG